MEEVAAPVPVPDGTLGYEANALPAAAAGVRVRHPGRYDGGFCVASRAASSLLACSRSAWRNVSRTRMSPERTAATSRSPGRVLLVAVSPWSVAAATSFANDIVDFAPDGVTVTVLPGEGFKSSRCGTWTKIG